MPSCASISLSSLRRFSRWRSISSSTGWHFSKRSATARWYMRCAQDRFFARSEFTIDDDTS